MPGDTNKPKTHLHDMVIHSIAFVDRGANNKRWLIAKRAADGAELQPPAPPTAPVPPTPVRPDPPMVVKAVALAPDESLEEFREDMCEALCALLNPGNIDSRRVWIRAIYEDHVVVQQGWDADETLLSLPYTRTGEDFKFGTATEVEEVTTFEPEPAAKGAPPAADGRPPVPSPPPAPDPAEVEKSKRAKAEQLARMWAAVSAMHELVKDLVAEVTAPPVPKPAGTTEPTGLEIAMGELQKRARAQEQELERLRKNHGASNAIPVDGPPPDPPPFVWPADIADPKVREALLRKDPRFERGQ